MRSGDIRVCGYDRHESLVNAQFFLDVNYSFPAGVANADVVYTPTDKVGLVRVMVTVTVTVTVRLGYGLELGLGLGFLLWLVRVRVISYVYVIY